VASEGKIAQVLVNLIINARDASKSGSEIHVRVDRVEDRAELERIFKSTELPAAAYGRIAVVDSGCGIPAELLERVFEPFFSTKGDKGTGLGLSTVAAIVRESGGAIVVNSEVDRGTTIGVYLPLVGGRASTASDTKSFVKREARGNKERVLIIDDESAVRNVIALSLQHLGYEVKTAASGGEGIEIIKNNPSAVDLVILDMLMPGLSGSEVFIELRKINPEVKVLLVSGFSSEEAVAAVLEGGGKGFLQKPFTIDELSARVKECLKVA
jgi:CheY-like chemotaxis protein